MSRNIKIIIVLCIQLILCVGLEVLWFQKHIVYKETSNKKDTLSKEEKFLKKIQEEQEKEKQKQKEILNQQEKINTKTGYTLKKNHTLAITYDYGKHWVDTNISINEAAFPNRQLRLSEESYEIKEEFTYFYYVNSKGWLMYTYSIDKGNTWQLQELNIAAFEATWFKAGRKENGQPYFFMADKLQKQLLFYQSDDNGAHFQASPSNFTKDIQEIYDVSYVYDSLIFVTYLQYGDIYRSTNQGLTYDAVHPQEMENIVQLKAPIVNDGILTMIGIDINQNEVMFTSIDHGNTWNRAN